MMVHDKGLYLFKGFTIHSLPFSGEQNDVPLKKITSNIAGIIENYRHELFTVLSEKAMSNPNQIGMTLTAWVKGKLRITFHNYDA